MRPGRVKSAVRAALFGAALIAATGFAASQPGVIIIDDDYGGSVKTYVDWWGRVRESQIPVRFRGMCISACTIGLSLPRAQMCVEPTASFGFHLASDSAGADEEFTRALILRYYPRQVQEWLENRRLTLNRLIFMSASEVVQLGIMPACTAASSGQGGEGQI